MSSSSGISNPSSISLNSKPNLYMLNSEGLEARILDENHSLIHGDDKPYTFEERQHLAGRLMSEIESFRSSPFSLPTSKIQELARCYTGDKAIIDHFTFLMERIANKLQGENENVETFDFEAITGDLIFLNRGVILPDLGFDVKSA